MSENIRGITFAEQTVTPADDAIVRRAILGDGVLTGCEVTYSGSTLTLAPGYIIACGRSFQITTAQNFAVVDAISGVARLLLTIDLTQTATEETFNQIRFSIEYAAAEDGFVDLIQDDINLSGIKYQIVCAVVSLGTGGITGIVSKLERTEGGGGLNFKVVPGLTQPGTASENTIWVKTERIGDWYFSATQPEGMQEWDVWFLNGIESAVEFNALKKHGIQVYPLIAKQYIGGVLVLVTAKSYHGGAWIPWWDGTIYNAGDLCEDVTGGWEQNPAMTFAGAANTGTATFNDSNVYLVSPENTAVIISTKNKVTIDTNRFSLLKFDITLGGYVSNDSYGIIDKYGNVYADFIASAKSTGSAGSRTTIEVPISNVPTGNYYVYAAVSSDRQRYVHKIWLE